jgi:hypothetical protein
VLTSALLLFFLPEFPAAAAAALAGAGAGVGSAHGLDIGVEDFSSAAASVVPLERGDSEDDDGTCPSDTSSMR